MRRKILIAATGLLAIVGAWFLPDRVPDVTSTKVLIHFASEQKQDTTPRPRFVIMDDWVRDYLAAEWDKHKADSVQLERGYCLRFQLDVWAQELAYRVTQISQPDSVTYAGPSEIEFFCTPAPNMAEIHVHPATTCVNGYCWNEGPYARQCLPSDADRRYLVRAKQPFGMVQCAREGSVFYFPMGDNR